MNIMKHRKWYYIISLAVILPGVISLLLWGVRPSIDFTGGTKIEISGTSEKNVVEEIAEKNGFKNITIIQSGNGLSLRSREVNQESHNKFKEELVQKGLTENSFETIGPTTSKEITIRAFVSVLLATALIILYIAYSFRRIPRPATSWEFGVTATAALFHDALVVLGVFSLLGRFYRIEVDPLFITAILTVIGFSMHDTIVFFDRIRENLIKHNYSSFEETVNRSILEVLPRALNTGFMVLGTLLLLLIFGGLTIRYFVLALVIGMFSGAYSSILTAAPLLIDWQNFKAKKNSR